MTNLLRFGKFLTAIAFTFCRGANFICSQRLFDFKAASTGIVFGKCLPFNLFKTSVN